MLRRNLIPLFLVGLLIMLIAPMNTMANNTDQNATVQQDTTANLPHLEDAVLVAPMDNLFTNFQLALTIWEPRHVAATNQLFTAVEVGPLKLPSATFTEGMNTPDGNVHETKGLTEVIPLDVNLSTDARIEKKTAEKKGLFDQHRTNHLTEVDVRLIKPMFLGSTTEGLS